MHNPVPVQGELIPSTSLLLHDMSIKKILSLYARKLTKHSFIVIERSERASD